MCGYTLLGTNPQQIMFILYGRERNGKSKTIEVLARIFADYAVNIAADYLRAKRFENAHSDLARLAGAHLAGLSRYYANGNWFSQATANLRTVSDTVG